MSTILSTFSTPFIVCLVAAFSYGERLSKFGDTDKNCRLVLVDEV
jgi:hypothetical protein